MSAVRMKPYVDENGNPVPEKDFRDVPASVMAAYLGIHPATLWRRVQDGMYDTGIIRRGRVRYFKPRKVLGIER